MKATVIYTATVSMYVDVDIPDDTPEDEREQVAYDLADEQYEHPGSLCHHCSQKYDTPEDFEAESVDFG